MLPSRDQIVLTESSINSACRSKVCLWVEAGRKRGGRVGKGGSLASALHVDDRT